MGETKSSDSRGPLDAVAIAIPLAALGAGLYAAFVGIDGWAVRTFARPLLASALIAVIDLALLGVAIALAPALSAAIRALGDLSTPRTSGGCARGSSPETPGPTTP